MDGSGSAIRVPFLYESIASFPWRSFYAASSVVLGRGRSLFFTPSRESCWRLNVWDFIGWTCSASDILAYREAGSSYSLVSGSASIGREEVIISLFYALRFG